MKADGMQADLEADQEERKKDDRKRKEGRGSV